MMNCKNKAHILTTVCVLYCLLFTGMLVAVLFTGMLVAVLFTGMLVAVLFILQRKNFPIVLFLAD